jgi:hypothetical protein
MSLESGLVDRINVHIMGVTKTYGVLGESIGTATHTGLKARLTIQRQRINEERLDIGSAGGVTYRCTVECTTAFDDNPTTTYRIFNQTDSLYYDVKRIDPKRDAEGILDHILLTVERIDGEV